MFETITLTVGAAFVLGLSFGAGPCSVTCLPFLGPMFVSGGSGWHQRLNILLPFTLGRLTGYSTLGIVAGLAGYAATELIHTQVASLLLGSATMVAGIMLLYRISKSDNACRRISNTCQSGNKPVILNHIQQNQPFVFTQWLSRFFIGFGLALNPCLPLTTILTAAAATASWSGGLSLGFSFGIGAVLLPTLIYAVVVAHLGEQIKHHAAQWRTTLENSAAVMLITLGAMTMGGYILV